MRAAHRNAGRSVNLGIACDALLRHALGGQREGVGTLRAESFFSVSRKLRYSHDETWRALDLGLPVCPPLSDSPDKPTGLSLSRLSLQDGSSLALLVHLLAIGTKRGLPLFV